MKHFLISCSDSIIVTCNLQTLNPHDSSHSTRIIAIVKIFLIIFVKIDVNDLYDDIDTVV